MKILMKKLTVAELLEAAKGTLEIDVTDEVNRMVATETEAMRAGLATKGDTNIDARLDAIEAALKAVPTAIDISPLATVLKVDGPDNQAIMQAIGELSGAVAVLKTSIAEVGERLAQTIANTAVKSDAKTEQPVITGFVTPEMRLAQQAGQTSKSTEAPFGRSVLTFN